MTDNSKFVLRWEINKASAVFGAKKAKPKVFNQGGFKWTAMVEEHHAFAKFTLKCAVSHNRPWKCEANGIIRVLDSSGIFDERMEKFVVSEANEAWWIPLFLSWAVFANPNYVVNDKVTVEFHIHISDRDELSRKNAEKFAVANNRSDVILKIEDEKMHVSKEILSIHSPVFEAMFFGDFVENGKGEIEIKDLLYEEFLDLLNVIYLESVITDRTVTHIMKLADRFHIERLMDLSKKHLIHSGINVMKKLIIADKYRIAELRDHCLNSFSSVVELDEKLKLTREVANFSIETKLAIFNRNSQLKTH